MCGVKWSDAFVSVNVRRGFMNCQIFCETGSIKRKIKSGIPAPEALKVKYVQYNEQRSQFVIYHTK
jgi:hypothetical protein